MVQPDGHSRSLLGVAPVCPDSAHGEVEAVTEDDEVADNPKECYSYNQDFRLSTDKFNVKRRQQSQDSTTQRPLKRQTTEDHVNAGSERTNILPVSTLCPGKPLQGIVPTNNHWSNQQLNSEHEPQVPESIEADSLTSDRSSISHGHDCCLMRDPGDIPSLLPTQEIVCGKKRVNETTVLSRPNVAHLFLPGGETLASSWVDTEEVRNPGDIPSLLPIQEAVCGKKRINKTTVLTRPNVAHLFLPGGETLASSWVDTEEHLEKRGMSTSESENIPFPQVSLENEPMTAEDRLNHPDIGKSILAERPLTIYRDIMPDPVIKPTRLQRLLAEIGINWHLNVVTQWLSKASVVQCHGFPIRRYTKTEIHKIQTFAEILFASSNLNDAFPLFHQAWVAQGGHFQHYLAVQCARSANNKSDRLLMVTILERLKLSFPEGASIHQQLFNVLAGPDYRPFYDVRQHNLWDALPSRVDEIWWDPTMFNDESLHIRHCLQSVDIILEKPSAMQSRELWRVKIVRAWPKCPRPSHIALLFHLLDSWSTDLYPTADTLLRYDRLSDLDILHVISFLVDDVDTWSMKFDHIYDWFNSHDTTHHMRPSGAKENLLLLLSRDDRTLLTGFYKASLFLNTNIAREAPESKLVTTQYRKLVVDSFKLRFRMSTGVHDDCRQPHSQRSPLLGSLRAETMMSAISVNPTLAKSLSTCSTLESMRRLSTITMTSFAHRWSRFSDVAMSLDELSDQASLMSISNKESVPSVLESSLSGFQEENANASAEILVATSTKPPVPIFWQPMGMIQKPGNRRISLPTPVDHILNPLVPKVAIKQFWARERNSA